MLTTWAHTGAVSSARRKSKPGTHKEGEQPGLAHQILDSFLQGCQAEAVGEATTQCPCSIHTALISLKSPTL